MVNSIFILVLINLSIVILVGCEDEKIENTETAETWKYVLELERLEGISRPRKSCFLYERLLPSLTPPIVTCEPTRRQPLKKVIKTPKKNEPLRKQPTNVITTPRNSEPLQKQPTNVIKNSKNNEPLRKQPTNVITTPRNNEPLRKQPTNVIKNSKNKRWFFW